MRTESGPELCPSPPFVSVEGVPNFRDIGGKPCRRSHGVEGDEKSQEIRRMRSGYLYRCAQPTHITINGRKHLTSELDIHDIFDLRSFKELRLVSSRYPDAPVDIMGVQRHHVPIYQDEDYTPISLAKKYDLGGDGTKEGPQGYVQAYADILIQGAKSGAFRTIVQHIIMHPDRPLAVHRTAGKDRTGVFAGSILSLCGVSQEEIVTDYAYTTNGLGKWREHLIKRLMEGAGDEYKKANGGKIESAKLPTREEAENIVASHPEHMRGFLVQVLEGQFGGARAYLREQCGMKDADLDVVVANLTEGV